ncbi:MAG: Imm42 family immunity protein [Caulobacter sp.]|nr:Imm42 family immunity protein [Caulobacter sp.]
MLFGDPQIFAIQVDLTDHSNWLNGFCFYWIDGQPFGDPEEHLSIDGMISSFIRTVKDGCDRADPGLKTMMDAEAFDRLYRHLYGDDLLEEIDEPARFEITTDHAQFGDRLIYAVEAETGWYRLLIGSHDKGFERAVRCPSVVLEDAFFDTYMYVNGITRVPSDNG